MNSSAEDKWITGNINFSIKGEPIEMELTVPANQVRLRRMLPILQMMTNSFVEMGEQAVKRQNENISCKAGCGACCRQAVPLAEIEVYQIAALVENLPEPRRREVKQRFADGVKRFHEKNWFERMGNFGDLTPQERKELILEYFYEGVACPFLENESCSIHTERPLSCREYLVTTPAENCAQPTAETVRPINILLKSSDTLREMAPTGHLDERKINFVPLIRALEWAEIYPENVSERPGQQWIGEFFQKLTNAKVISNDAETNGN